MRGARRDRILASTALALVLAVPFSATRAEEAGKLAATAAAVQDTTGSTTPSEAATRPETAQQPSSAAVAAPATATAAEPAPVSTVEPAPASAVEPAQNAAPAPNTSPAAESAPAASTTPATAAAPAVAPDPMAALDPADRTVAERIRDLLAGKADRIFATKKERAAAEAFYQARSFAPLWLDKGVENARAKAVLLRLKGADADGLVASEYKTPALTGEPDALADADLKFTQVLLTFARHLQAGRFPYSRISHNNMELPQAPPEPADVLTKLAGAADPAAALDQFSPPQPAYQGLKNALAQLRGKAGGESKQIADGPLLKLVAKTPMEDSRVPLLRERLGLAADPGNVKYDAKLAEAVKKFQRGADLPVTGNLDAKTIKELNGPAHDKQIDMIIANMERWRWYSRDLGASYSMINQPDFTLKVVKDGNTVWTTRVVIGKPSMQTPLLSETMKYITINPTWNVPPSIVQNEYLPALQQDPTVLARMGLRVETNRDGSVHISQPPGDGNALGRVRFNFPNRFLVYQHDTPDKHLFAHDVRAYSHGCMRVQDPAKYAEVLLGIARPNEGWTAERVKRMFGHQETDIQIQPTPIWVHLTYQTAFVDDAGKLELRRDVYGLDSRTVAAIKSERGMIDPPQERKREQEIASSQRRAAPPRTVSFFQSLFGGGGGPFVSSPAPYGSYGPYGARPVPPRRVVR